MKALLVDDERLARKRLTHLLQTHPDITIVGEAENVASAAELAAQVKPDIVFLDVQMPPDKGFDLLPLLPLNALVVFVTAFDTYAVQAFEAAAIDYLVKPISAERLAMTIQRLARQGSHATSPEIIIKDANTWVKLNLDSICSIQSDGIYTDVFNINSQTYHVRRSIKEWILLLPGDYFIQLDRSLIVRLQSIHQLKKVNRDEAELFFSADAAPLKIGRQALRTLRSRMDKDDPRLS